MWEILAAIGLVLAVEGLLYAAFPAEMKRAMAQILELRPDQLRYAGLVAAAIGVAIVWIARRGLF